MNRADLARLVLAFALALSALPIAPGPSAAQGVVEDRPDASTGERRRKRLADFDPALPDAPKSQALDPETSKKYETALRRYYDYRIDGYDHRQDVFEWQYLSSKIIFFTVLILVFAGIYFAAVQFHSGLGRRARGAAPDAEDTTEFVATLKGIKVKSPVLGVVILVISLAFFYLYLVYVYPIENVF